MPARLLGALLVVGLAAAACSPDDHGGDASTTTGISARPPDASAAPTTAPAGDPSAAEPTRPGRSEPPASLSDWSPCGSLECATLTVPLDYDDPDGASARIPVTRRAATGDRIGALLLNPGGPGAPGTAFGSGSNLSEELRSRFDLIAWDPRGTGGSTLLDCDEPLEDLWSADSSPDNPAEQAELDRSAAAVADRCATDHGDVLPYVDTESTIADMDALRRVLGEETLSYIGFSYGTYLGLRYAERYGGHLRAMVLDGVVDPDQDLEEFMTGQLLGFRRAFDDMVASCDRDCPLDDVEAALDRVLGRSERDPLRTSSGRRLGSADVVTGTFYSAYGFTSEAWSDYHDAVAAAADGDGDFLLALADRYHDLANFGAYLAISCVDRDGPTTPEAFAAMAERLAQIDARFGAAQANELAPCGSWAAPSTGVQADVTATDAPTVLVLGNTGDQVTPYENSVEVAGELERAALVTLDATGHLSYRNSSCVRDVVDDYLVGLAVPPEGARC